MPTGNTLHIAVCDDLPSDLAKITDMTTQILQEADIANKITQYDTGVSLLADMQSGVQFHILLLDVMMGELDGIKLAARLRQQGNDTQIVFVSSNREMALRGYEVNAVRYLAKPLEQEKLKEALLYCVRMQKGKKEILLPTERGEFRTPFSDIQYVEAFDRGTKVVLKDKTLETRWKLSEIAVLLPESDFLRCHRSYVVNLACVTYVHQYEFILQSGMTVPIGQARYTEIRNQFADYLAE